VPVPDVVRRELVMPAHLPRIAVERDDRRGVQVVAFAELAVVIRSGIACAPENEIQLRIVGASGPCRTAPVLPGLGVLTLPGSVARVLRTGGRIEPPRSLPGVNVIGIDKAPNAVLGASHARNNLVLEGERRWRAAVAVP